MGVITDILVGIPLSVVIRKRLVDKEAYIAILEAENTAFKAKIAILEVENAESKAKLQKIENDEAIYDNICPKCHKLKGKLLDERPTFYDGQFGLRTKTYKCENCGHKYEKQKNQNP